MVRGRETQAERSASEPGLSKPDADLCPVAVVAADQLDSARSGEHVNGIFIGAGRGTLNCSDLACFDILVTDVIDAPYPWVEVLDIDAAIANLTAAISSNPFASQTLVHVLRSTEAAGFENALTVESIAYSMLLGAQEFGDWRSRTQRLRAGSSRGERVRIGFNQEVLHISLARPAARNAVDAEMRDQMVDALAFALAESESRRILLTGDGPDFCAGGDLDEFGTADDPAKSHLIRMQQSPVRLLRKLSQRLTVRLHGACIGAGIEIPAAASRIVARADAWFRLPEVGMGLIPGAGGTVTIPRRIGRHRTCYLALVGERLKASTALQWGLIDEIHD